MKRRRESVPNKAIKEARLSRLYQYVEDRDKDFAIISASRSEYSADDNAERFNQLKETVRELGYGYIELRGGYIETAEDGKTVEVTEDSLLIPKIEKDEAIALGSEFEQESILYKNSESMAYILTTGENIGKTDMEFKFGANRSNFSVDDPLNAYFSSLKKGPHRSKKISFKALYERSYSCETQRQGLAGGMANPIYRKVDFNESASRSPSRFRTLFTNSKQAFAMISAHRTFVKDGDSIRQLSGKENRRRSNQLSSDLDKLAKEHRTQNASGFHISAVPVFGGYKDIKSDIPTELERSFIVAISQEDKKDDRLSEMEELFYEKMIALGTKYGQESVLIKDSRGLRYVGTCDEQFDITIDGRQYNRDNNVGEVLATFSSNSYEINEKDVFEYFTRLQNRDITFVSTPQISQPNSMTESFLNRSRITWQTIYEKPHFEINESHYGGPSSFDHTFSNLFIELEPEESEDISVIVLTADVSCIGTPFYAGNFYEPETEESVEIEDVTDVIFTKVYGNNGEELSGVTFKNLSDELQRIIEAKIIKKLEDDPNLIAKIKDDFY